MSSSDNELEDKLKELAEALADGISDKIGQRIDALDEKVTEKIGKSSVPPCFIYSIFGVTIFNTILLLILLIKLRLFTTEGDLRDYAKINGHDSGRTDKLAAQWKALSKEKETLVLTKKVGVITTMETKSDDGH